MQRSKNYQNVYNTENGFMSARNSDGNFLTQINSHIDESDQVVEEGITEGGGGGTCFGSESLLLLVI